MNTLPLPAEHLIREAALLLAASRRNFRSRQVQAALDYLVRCLRKHGRLPWPPERTNENPGKDPAH